MYSRISLPGALVPLSTCNDSFTAFQPGQEILIDFVTAKEIAAGGDQPIHLFVAQIEAGGDAVEEPP